jgi:iron complex transport system substrate-binding protein
VAMAVWFGWYRFSVSSAPPRLTSGFNKPVRIASLTLASDEILSELVSPDRIVCLTSLADDPGISNVASFYPKHIPRLRETDPERIIGFNPDLVCVAPFNSADFLKVMERSGLSTYRNEAIFSMVDIEASILQLGNKVGEPERAQAVVDHMRGRRQALAGRVQKVARRPRILFWSAGFTAGRRTTIDDIIREAGGINVAAERNLEGTAEISPEQVLAANPEIILQSRWSGDEGGGNIEHHPLLRNLQAVHEKRVISMEAKSLTCISQYVVEGAERLAQALHFDQGEP